MSARHRTPAPFQPTLGDWRGGEYLPSDRFSWERGVLARVPNWLGDGVMALPALWSLRQRLPEGAPLSVLTRDKVADFWRRVPWVDRLFAVPHKALTETVRHQLRQAGYGVAIVLPNSFRSALDIWQSGVPVRVGRGDLLRGALLTHRLPSWRRQAGRDERHQAAEYLELVASLGASGNGLDFPPPTPPEKLPERLADLPRPWLTMAPGAAFGPAKQWPPDRFQAVGDWWLKETGGGVVVVGAPGDREAAKKATPPAESAIDLAGETSLSELMGILAASSAVIANDSGTMHLAAALACRGVAIFGSTEPLATGPLAGTWYVLREKLECSPCLKRTCQRDNDHYACLTRIAVDQVTACLAALPRGAAC